MAKKPNYDDLVANSNVRTMLDMIANAEGTAGHGDNGYNVAFGHRIFEGYDKHPQKVYEFKQTDGKTNKTSAAGRYQFLSRTAQNLQHQMGLKDFSPLSQDKMAVELMRQAGALDNVLMGDYETAINKLGKIWASLPSSPYAQPKKTMEEVLAGGSISTASPAPSPVPQDMPQGQEAGMEPQVGGTLPIVNMGGQNMVALPDNDYEQENLTAFALNDYPIEKNTMLASALGQISKAREKLKPTVELFDSPLPNDLDSDLLELIDKA